MTEVGSIATQVNSRERVETLDVLGDELIAGIEVFTKGGGGGIVSIELFDSQVVDDMDQTSSIYVEI